MAQPWARRTVRLGDIQRRIVLASGGEPGSRLAARLAMPASDDTLLRLVQATRPEPPPLPRVVGAAPCAGLSHCRKAFGADAALIGFGTDRGTVAAASDWNGPVELKQVRPAQPGSHEALFREAGLRRSLTCLHPQELPEALVELRLERAIGVLYRPETELQSHHFEAVLPEQFDAFAWFEESTAVAPLPGPQRQGEAETFPFGT